MMTFTAQNDGAKKPKRIKDGFRSGIVLEICYAVFICAVLLLFDNQQIGLFGDSKQMISEGSRYFAVMAFFYWLPGVTNAKPTPTRPIRGTSKNVKITRNVICVSVP